MPGKSNPIGAVDPELAKLGFKRLKARRIPRISMEVSGKTKGGKTHLMMTMTEPIGIINTDRALDDILPEFPDVDFVLKDLSPMFAPGQELGQKEAQLIEREFSRAYDGLLGNRHVRSIGIDKWTAMWEVARYAEFGRASVKAHHYVPVNMRMRGYLMKYQSHDKNLLLLQDVKEEWINEKPTGRYIVDGFKYTPGLMQVNAFAYREEEGNRLFKLQITGCGLNSDLMGWEFEGDGVDWHKIAPMVLPDTKASDWL
jgi:hypothetical protein